MKGTKWEEDSTSALGSGLFVDNPKHGPHIWDLWVPPMSLPYLRHGGHNGQFDKRKNILRDKGDIDSSLQILDCLHIEVWDLGNLLKDVDTSLRTVVSYILMAAIRKLVITRKMHFSLTVEDIVFAWDTSWSSTPIMPILRETTQCYGQGKMLFLNLHFGWIVLSLDSCRLTFLMKIFGFNMMCGRDFKYYSCCTLPMSITSKNCELEMLYYNHDGLFSSKLCMGLCIPYLPWTVRKRQVWRHSFLLIYWVRGFTHGG